MQPVRLSKFCFQIRTRGGALVNNLMIPGRDEEEARRRLQQIYHNCEILNVSQMPAETGKAGHASGHAAPGHAAHGGAGGNHAAAGNPPAPAGTAATTPKNGPPVPRKPLPEKFERSFEDVIDIIMR